MALTDVAAMGAFQSEKLLAGDGFFIFDGSDK
jgi:hypothetical protein